MDFLSGFSVANMLGFDYQCSGCLVGAELLFKYHKMGWNPEKILSSLSSLCALFKVQSKVWWLFHFSGI